MDNQYENLQPSRIRKLGFVLLGMFIVLILVNNRAIYPILEAGGPRSRQGFFAAMCGVVFAQFSLLGIWSVLSPQSLLRRAAFLVCAATALIAAWMLGFVASRYPDPDQSIRWLELEEFSVFGFVPIVLLAHALPLIGLRFFSSTVLVQLDQVPPRQFVSIAGLLFATGIIAFAIAAIQVPTGLGLSYSEALGIAATGSGIALAIGLLAVLPAVRLLFSRRGSFWIRSTALLLYAAATTGAIFSGLRLFQLSPPESTWLFVILITSQMIVVVIGIGILRMLGYRLGKSAVERKPAGN